MHALPRREDTRFGATDPDGTLFGALGDDDDAMDMDAGDGGAGDGGAAPKKGAHVLRVCVHSGNTLGPPTHPPACHKSPAGKGGGSKKAPTARARGGGGGGAAGKGGAARKKGGAPKPRGGVKKGGGTAKPRAKGGKGK